MATLDRDHTKLICDIGELSAIITDASDLDAMLQKIVDTAAIHMQADVCSVYLFDEEHHELVLRATRGLLPSSVGKVRLSPGEGLTGLAFSERRPVCEADAPKHPNYRYFPGIGEEPYRSFVAVPILRGRRPIGAMTLESKQPGHFSAEDVQVFRAITMQLATTIEMARLLLTLEAPAASRTTQGEQAELRFVHGQVGAEGCVLGEAVVIRQPSLAEIRALMGSTALKLSDFRRAVADTEKQLEHLEKLAGERLSDITAVIFSAQLLMLRDQSWLGSMEEQITAGTSPAEAVYRVVLNYVERFERMDNAYMREKRYDVMDVGRRLLANLSGHHDAEASMQGRIAIAAELLPSEVLKLGLEKVGGIVLLSGGITSHVAVLARSLDLPLIFVDEPRLLEIAEGTRVVLDARQGNLYVAPSEEIEQRFREQEDARGALQQAEDMRPETYTADGVRVRLLANINLIADVELARSYKAEGIGLYRTEFPFMIRNDFPSEEEQLHVYRRLIEGMPGREITFRTLDVGGDKMLSYFDYGAEANPFLGLRSIRFSLRHREVFLQQVRAILRAAHDIDVRIMFPMISSPDELAAAAEAVDECRASLKREGMPACKRVELGMMLEVPSVLEMMDELAQRADFFSIGTNDFVQYMLAVDRTNVHVADLYVPHHPAVLRGLHRAITAALDRGRDVSVCGDMAHDPRFVRFLLGIGVRKLSMSARYMPRVQQAIYATRLDQARSFAKRLLAESTVSGTTRVLEGG